MSNDVLELPILIVQGNLNAFNQKLVKELTDKYYYPSSNIHTVNSNIHFNKQMSIDYLNASTLNGMIITTGNVQFDKNQ